MAQPNMVREPSMDEILASIRRIIESNEPVTQAGVATAMAEPEGFSGRPANDDTEEVTLTVDDAFADVDDDYGPADQTRPVLRAISETETSMVRDFRQAESSQYVQPQAPKSLSLADVAARVRAASERSSMMMRETAQIEPVRAEQPPATAAEPVAPAVMDQPLQPQSTDSSDNRQDFVADHRETMPAEVAREQPSAQPEPYSSEPVSLLSSSVGEQVARSFQDLAFAIDNADRRSFDQIAEDMMRPMLQEWLDDNLPTLVERLVREEIERVARGPRR